MCLVVNRKPAATRDNMPTSFLTSKWLPVTHSDLKSHNRITFMLLHHCCFIVVMKMGNLDLLKGDDSTVSIVEVRKVNLWYGSRASWPHTLRIWLIWLGLDLVSAPVPSFWIIRSQWLKGINIQQISAIKLQITHPPTHRLYPPVCVCTVYVCGGSRKKNTVMVDRVVLTLLHQTHHHTQLSDLD